MRSDYDAPYKAAGVYDTRMLVTRPNQRPVTNTQTKPARVLGLVIISGTEKSDPDFLPRIIGQKNLEKKRRGED